VAASAPRATAARPTAASTRPAATAPAHSATAWAAKATTILLVIVGKQDGVNHRVGALGRFDGALQRLFAASVVSVGKNNERLAALLFFHQFVGGQEDGIVKQSATSSAHPRLAAPGTRRRLRIGGLRVGRSSAIAIKLRGPQQLKSRLQFVVRR